MSMTNDQRMQWIKANTTLHKNVSFMYVVDGYEVTLTNSKWGCASEATFKGETIFEAIDLAMAESSTGSASA